MKRGKKSLPEGEKKRPITAHLDPDVYTYVQGVAAEGEVTVSEAVNALLRRASMHRDSERWWDVLGAQVERRIKAEVGGMSNRLAHLLARSALEATAGRELLRLEMTDRRADGSQENVQSAEQEVNALREIAWKYAVRDLKKPSQGIRELLEIEYDNER